MPTITENLIVRLW